MSSCRCYANLSNFIHSTCFHRLFPKNVYASLCWEVPIIIQHISKDIRFPGIYFISVVVLKKTIFCVNAHQGYTYSGRQITHCWWYEYFILNSDPITMRIRCTGPYIYTGLFDLSAFLCSQQTDLFPKPMLFSEMNILIIIDKQLNNGMGGIFIWLVRNLIC